MGEAMTREPTEMELRVLAEISEFHSGDSKEGMKIVRAAIRAMRKPTPSMEVAAGDPSRKSLGQLPMSHLYKCAYQAMIDAASPEDK